MKRLSYLLYPLCIIGAIYSLIYNTHKRLEKSLDRLINNILILFLYQAGIRGLSTV